MISPKPVAASERRMSGENTMKRTPAAIPTIASTEKNASCVSARPEAHRDDEGPVSSKPEDWTPKPQAGRSDVVAGVGEA
ncbi:hypothetical protein [Microbacterium sp. Leaf151]|uniref:hypothetical protein n=1 Tax=Microbacterium sp. Leaf151 TaxID=1736276 RepID=UPI0012E37332|nr:hypothetical protein [Microbacterium sp. Leaf151]